MLPNLILAIKDRGARHYDLAHTVKMSEAHFSRKLNGYDEFSPIEKKRIAEYLNTNEAWLFETTLRIPRRTSSG